jgi:hypothetical protein
MRFHEVFQNECAIKRVNVQIDKLIMTWRNDIQHKGIQHKDTQHNDTQYYDIQHNNK